MAYIKENKYLIAIVEPLRDNCRQPVQVEVYERLDTSGVNPPVPKAQHVRFVGKFPLHSEGKALSLEEIFEKIKQRDFN